MEKKILKIASILKNFSVDDLSTYMECDASEITPYLKDLEENAAITKLPNNNYLYENVNRVKPRRRIRRKKEDNEKKYFNYSVLGNQLFNLENFRNFPAEQVFLQKEDLEYYNNSDERMKKYLIKNVVLFSLVGRRSEAETKLYLNKIAEEHPEYKINDKWYMEKYKRYREGGLCSLYQNRLCSVDNAAYEEFKKIYLTPKRYSATVVYELLKMKGFDSDLLPSLMAFMHRLNSEFSKEAIERFRSEIKKEEYSDDVVTLKYVECAKDTLFKNAVKEYLHIIALNKIQIRPEKKRNISNLNKYFGKYELRDISIEEIVEYRKKLIAEGWCISTVRGIILLLLEILKINRVNLDASIFDIVLTSYKIYSYEEIKDIVKQCGPEAWIIALGLKLTELQVLQYEDIDHEKKVVLINKRYQRGRIIKYNVKSVKSIKIPKLLLNNIDKNKTGLIFGQVEMPTYESCLCTHIKLLQDQNVPFHLIAKEMRYKDLKTFYSQFHQLFPKEMDDNFDIFKPLGIVEKPTKTKERNI